MLRKPDGDHLLYNNIHTLHWQLSKTILLELVDHSLLTVLEKGRQPHAMLAPLLQIVFSYPIGSNATILGELDRNIM